LLPLHYQDGLSAWLLLQNSVLSVVALNLVVLVASALSRWFFSVVIASKLCSQRGSFELLAL
jgi:hypothetical protein